MSAARSVMKWTVAALFAVGLTLFVITLVINVISIALVRRFRQVY